MYHLFCYSLLILFALNSHANEIDILKDLVSMSSVEENLKRNVNVAFGDGTGERADVVDRIGLSNLFLVNIDGNAFISDSTGGFLSSASNLKKFTNHGLFNAMTSNNATEDNIKFYEYAKTQKNNLPVFKGTGKDSGLIVAFMDPSCPNCKQFHLVQRLKVNSLGYDVMYIPSARNPKDKKVMNSLVHYYCRKDRMVDWAQTLYNDYKKARYKSKQNPLESCSSIDESYIRHLSEVFSRHMMLGSPAFITPDGMTLYGYNELDMYLNKK